MPKEETSSLKPRPHCGLYCLYSILKLSGQDLDFRDLVKPAYYGRLMGSSLAELNQGAKDYGLYAGVVTRLSTRALRDCPYWAILHVRRNPEAKEYDHYQLFLGTENGRAKLFNPPEGVKLVQFSDLRPCGMDMPCLSRRGRSTWMRSSPPTASGCCCMPRSGV